MIGACKMKVNIRCANPNYPENNQSYDVVVVYPRNCVVSILSMHDDSFDICVDHPYTANLTEQSDYPQKMLWVEPAYKDD